MTVASSSNEGAAGLLQPSRWRPDLADFVVGSTNRFAHAVILSIVEGTWRSDQNPVLVTGPCGVGKSHLLKALRRAFAKRYQLKEGAVYTTSEAFTNLFIEASRDRGGMKMVKFRQWARMSPLFIVDEVDFFVGKKATGDEFLVTLEERIRSGRPTVLACNTPPRELILPSPLVSRLLGGLISDIGPLTTEIRRGLLNRLINKVEAGLLWTEESRGYLVSLLDGDARVVTGTFNAVDLYCRTFQSVVGKELIDRVLNTYGLGGETFPELSLEVIEIVVEEYFGLLSGGSHQLRSRSKSRDICHPRQVAMFLAKQLLPCLSLTEIGNHFGRRDHTTVISALARIERERRAPNSVIERELEALCRKLRVKWPL